MRYFLAIALLMTGLTACAGRLPAVARLTDARQGDAALTVEQSSLGETARDDDVTLALVHSRPALVATIQPQRDRRVELLWEESAFVWPDGRSEPILGAAPGVGAGKIGFRAPTRLLAGVPNAVPLTPQSRAGRALLGNGDVPVGLCRLELALRVDGQVRRYVLTFSFSS